MAKELARARARACNVDPLVEYKSIFIFHQHSPDLAAHYLRAIRNRKAREDPENILPIDDCSPSAAQRAR